MNPINALLAVLGAVSIAFAALWGWTAAAARRASGHAAGAANPALDARFPNALQVAVGFFTNFFDALGIGSFATTTAIFRWFKMVPDRIIPGTLNVGHTMPTVVQAFIFTQIIPVDVLTLISMIAASVLGAWLGAGVVARWPKRKIQIGKKPIFFLSEEYTGLLTSASQSGNGSRWFVNRMRRQYYYEFSILPKRESSK
jgi:uncharacterized membrane protein YfcA